MPKVDLEQITADEYITETALIYGPTLWEAQAELCAWVTSVLVGTSMNVQITTEHCPSGDHIEGMLYFPCSAQDYIYVKITRWLKNPVVPISSGRSL